MKNNETWLLYRTKSGKPQMRKVSDTSVITLDSYKRTIKYGTFPQMYEEMNKLIKKEGL